MKNVCVLLTCLLLAPYLQAQFATQKLQPNKLPSNISYKSMWVDGRTWRDSAGLHYLLLSETGVYRTPGSDPVVEDSVANAAIFAVHYTVKHDSLLLVWQLTDYEKDCLLDVLAAFEKNALRITDLNRNKIPEIWLIYKTTCTGDVSPRTMKLMMYEGKRKLAIRGTTRVQTPGEKPYGGTMKWDAA